ncbi:hypothetical protein HPS12939_1591 [Glaesserella parasuis 12939]|nr:hypothetical protein HPS12939_1591 [Glaesserella parasuis 12939]
MFFLILNSHQIVPQFSKIFGKAQIEMHCMRFCIKNLGILGW